MYLNEKSWNGENTNDYEIAESLKHFLDIYALLAGQFGQSRVYVPDASEPYLRETAFSVGKWLSQTKIMDREYYRLYMSFWQKRAVFHPEEEYEARYEGDSLEGGIEAILNQSFLISLDLQEKWRRKVLPAKVFSLSEDREEEEEICNVFAKEQLLEPSVQQMLQDAEKIQIRSYSELWREKGNLFPHLRFCPSVERDLQKLESMYLNQIVKKLPNVSYPT